MKRQLYGSTNPDFSIVIPAYNEEDFLPQCLRSLQEQDYIGEFEVIVVDNNSADATTKVAHSFGAKVMLETERGVCAARQTGTAAANAPIIVSTDADTTFHKHWLQNIADEFAAHDDLVAVCGAPVFVDSPLWGKAVAGIITTYVKAYNRLLNTTCYISAANTAFKRSAFTGYNTKLTQGGDELYLLKQLKKNGRVVLKFDNPVYTSSRRLYRGFFYNVFVTQILYYVFDYNFARITGRSLLGGYPAFRDKNENVLQKRNVQIGVLFVVFCAVLMWVWQTDNNRVQQAEQKVQQLELRIKNFRRK
jgi:glycosyltransferase involved in cell wall biosynthesis